MTTNTSTSATMLGDQLRDARVALGMSLADVAKDTRIRRDYLEAIETHTFKEIPYATIYLRNFIKRFAQAVDLDPAKLAESFDRIGTDPTSDAAPTPKSHKKPSYHLRFPNIPRIIRGLIILSVVAVAIGYLATQVNAMVSPPALAVAEPQNGAVLETATVTVTGNTEQEIRVHINGEEISTSVSGQFSESLTLSPGINTLQVTACSKHGRCTNEVRHVTYSP